MDAGLAETQLRREGISFISERVETQEEFSNKLTEFNPDLVLADYSLPSFDGLSALEIARRKRPDLPFIIFSGSMGEELAIEAVKAGARKEADPWDQVPDTMSEATT